MVQTYIANQVYTTSIFSNLYAILTRIKVNIMLSDNLAYILVNFATIL